MNDYNSNKETGKALIPRLRFPEFQNSGEWGWKRLDELIEEFIEKTKKNFEFPLLTSSRKGIFFQEEYFNDRKVASKNNIGYNIIPEGYITYRSMSDDGNFYFNVNNICEKGMISPAYPVFKVIENKVVSYFLLLKLNEGKEVKAFITSNTQGSTRKALQLTTLKKLKLLIPSLPEQQKIASCLSSIDEVIAGERQRLELLRAHKKGLLQNLFPREGETVPKLRFPEFKDSGEWEEKIIGEIGETINGLTNKSANDFGKGSPFITYLQVYEDSMVNLDKCSFVNIELNEKQNTIHKGDILITTSSETPDEVGFASVMLNEPAQDTYLNSFCFCLRPHKKANLLPEFSRYLFRSNLYRKQINKIAQGITRFNLSKQSFLKVLLLIPPLPEQQKIADCLSSLDELINAQQQKIELLEQYKKGFLQGLFPNVYAI
ncbi:MAG TPA: restriction endonuclease subunit S [Bacteroidales bacterium]|nr:restriction endonuclease subunit S [Bacteroidales bacterium]